MCVCVCVCVCVRACVGVCVVYVWCMCGVCICTESQHGNSAFNPFYPEYDSSRSYPFYPEYDSSRSLHLTRLPCTLTFWNPIGWLRYAAGRELPGNDKTVDF